MRTILPLDVVMLVINVGVKPRKQAASEHNGQNVQCLSYFRLSEDLSKPVFINRKDVFSALRGKYKLSSDLVNAKSGLRSH